MSWALVCWPLSPDQLTPALLGMVMLETTNNIFDLSIYKYVTPQSVLVCLHATKYQLSLAGLATCAYCECYCQQRLGVGRVRALQQQRHVQQPSQPHSDLQYLLTWCST